MPTANCDSLLAVLARLTDTRHRRGVHQPFAGRLAVTFLGQLSRQSDFATATNGASCAGRRGSPATTPPTPAP